MNKKPLLLLVDDEVDVLDSLARIIDSTGEFDYVLAKGGQEALDVLYQHRRWGRLAKNKIDGIILDVQMPGMTGLEFLKIWRKKESFLDLMPVILLTAHEDEYIWTSSTDVGDGLVVSYLKKPVRVDSFLDVCRRAIIYKEAEFMIDETRQKGYQRRRDYQEGVAISE